MPKENKCILAIVASNLWKDFYFCKSRNIHSAYLGTLSSIVKSYDNVKIIMLESDEQFCDFLVSLHNKLTSEGKSTRPAPVFRTAKSTKERRENALTAIQGIGVQMARKLLSKYGTINAIANATEEDLMSIDKLGKATAKNILETLN